MQFTKYRPMGDKVSHRCPYVGMEDDRLSIAGGKTQEGRAAYKEPFPYLGERGIILRRLSEREHVVAPREVVLVVTRVVQVDGLDMPRVARPDDRHHVVEAKPSLARRHNARATAHPGRRCAR